MRVELTHIFHIIHIKIGKDVFAVFDKKPNTFLLNYELGYSFDLALDADSGEPVQADRWYHYASDFGLVARGDITDPSRPAYAGADLITMAGGEFGGAVRVTAKRLLRQALADHLGNAPLRSRELFRTRKVAVVQKVQNLAPSSSGDEL